MHPLISLLDRSIEPQDVEYQWLISKWLGDIGIAKTEDALVTKAFSDCIYHNFDALGLSFCFDISASEPRKPLLGAIHIFSGRRQTSISPFASERTSVPVPKRTPKLPATLSKELLPYNLSLSTTLQECVKMFAPTEPEKGGGGQGIGPGIWIRYPQHGLTAEFAGRTWTDGDLQWTEITLERAK